MIEYLAAYQPPRIDQPHNPRDSGLILAAVVAHLTMAVVLVLAIRQARRGKLVGLGCVIGAFALSWGEALYDDVFHLTFHAAGATLWSPFGIDLPIWLPAGYVMAYGMGGWLVAEQVLRGGVTRRDILRTLAVTWIGCYVFETFAFQVGAFEYYEHPITVLGTPLWVETFNAVFIVVAGLLIALVQPVVAGAGALTQFGVTTLIYLVGFTGLTYGPGFVALNILNSPHADTGWLWVAVAASQVIALAVLWVVVDLASLAPALRDSLGPGPRLLKVPAATSEPAADRP